MSIMLGTGLMVVKEEESPSLGIQNEMGEMDTYITMLCREKCYKERWKRAGQGCLLKEHYLKDD